MNYRKICESGTNSYRAKCHLNDQFYKQKYRNYRGSAQDFVAECVQEILSRYDESKPPCLETVCRPFKSISNAVGYNIRDSVEIKSFISGYKCMLEEIGKKRNYTCPVFLDHGVQVMKACMTNLCQFGLEDSILEIQFLFLMKIYFGSRTADLCKIRYSDLRRLSDVQYAIGSDGRK